MGLLKEFKEFALKGNVLDLAVGVIIGAEFGKIVNSIIADLIMPVISKAGGVNFSNRYIPLSDQIKEGMPLAEVRAASLPAFAYGNFITIVINFLILAFCIFLVVKAFNMARKRFEKEQIPPPPGPTPDQKLLTEIRDLLARR